MQATELRIGNYCKEITPCRNRITQVSKDHFIDMDQGEIDLFPIPLTEEWLVKFGFGKSDEHEMSLEVDIIGLKECDVTIFYDYHFKRFTLDSEFGTQLIPHIKYVHQLQNLYFALTGEELCN